jgi:hypothetical protein
VAGHIAKPAEGGAVAWDAGTVVSAAGTGPAHPGIAGQAAGVESAAGLESMAIAQHQVVGIEVEHCSHTDVRAAVEVQVLGVGVGTANGGPKLGSGVGSVGEVCCEAAVREGTAGSDSPRCCMEGVETAGIVEAVVRVAGRSLPAERPL